MAFRRCLVSAAGNRSLAAAVAGLGGPAQRLSVLS
jgi:hypothetical protein